MAFSVAFVKGKMASNSTCPPPMKATSNGAFQGDSPLDYALPLVIVQICLVFVLTRSLALLLKPLHQPRVIAEIVGGILLGPSALGRNKQYLNAIFPPRSLTVLDTLANLGLLFYLFLVGLELDLKSLRRTGKKALCIAVAGISVPFVLGIGTSHVLLETIANGVSGPPFLIFMGVALSITAFPVLARILAELKLLTTDVGRLAMSAAAVNDVAAWILLALAVALSGHSSSPLISLWVLLCGCGFVLCCVVVVPAVFRTISLRCSDGEPVSEMFICSTLVAVLAAGLITDVIGIHALFGAFVLGVLIPKEGPFASALVEKVEDLVSGLFLPLYFASSGLKTNVATIHGVRSWGLLVMVIVTACTGKIAGTVVVSYFSRMPCAEAVTLGFLMNTKGLVELIVLNIGKDRKVLNDETFAIMVLMALFTTFITTPIVMAVYKPAKSASRADYKYRTIEREDTNTQLRVLICFHSTRNIPTIINLIEASRGIEKKQALCVYTMHLMELSERPSAILKVHKARKDGRPFWNKSYHSDDNQVVVVAFEAFRQLNHVVIRPMTEISGLHDMHEDICSSAERKMVAMIILPFHKHQMLDGALETTRSEFRSVNKSVLERARCSVGILVDRGLGGATHIPASNLSSEMTVFFFGGRDDREALAYGARMAEHPGIRLTVIRFSPAFNIVRDSVGDHDVTEEPHRSVVQSSADGNLIMAFRKNISGDSSIKFEERTVSNSSDIVDTAREFSRSNLFLVGRTPDAVAATSLMNARMECPELGPVGNLLASPEFATTASVLVVQQYSSTDEPSSKFV